MAIDKSTTTKTPFKTLPDPDSRQAWYVGMKGVEMLDLPRPIYKLRKGMTRNEMRVITTALNFAYQQGLIVAENPEGKR